MIIQDLPVRNELIHCVICVVQISEGRGVGLSQQEVPLQRFLWLHDAELLCAQKSQEEASVYKRAEAVWKIEKANRFLTAKRLPFQQNIFYIKQLRNWNECCCEEHVVEQLKQLSFEPFTQTYTVQVKTEVHLFQMAAGTHLKVKQQASAYHFVFFPISRPVKFPTQTAF